MMFVRSSASKSFALQIKTKENFFMKKTFKEWWEETILLFRSIPGAVLTIFSLSVVVMNILANKTIVQLEYLNVDGGIVISWISFLAMDVVTKHFGPKAATKMCVFALLINTAVSIIFFLIAKVPDPSGEFKEFDNVIGGTWFILVSSSVAFISSGIINNVLNWTVGKLFKKNPDGKLAFFCRSYLSTFIGQFSDNLIFAVLAFIVFGPLVAGWTSWTIIQCITCSLLGAGLELLMEVIFSPIGYFVSRKWKERHVGEEYLSLVNNYENTNNR